MGPYVPPPDCSQIPPDNEISDNEELEISEITDEESENQNSANDTYTVDEVETDGERKGDESVENITPLTQTEVETDIIIL
jgi:hypothetical protein